MTALLDYLQGRGVPFQAIPHPQTATSLAEAHALGVPEEEVAKTLVIIASSGPALLVIPASRRLDMDLVRRAVNDPEARLATERELMKAFPDYELGALPPLGLFLLAPMYVDPAVTERESITFAAGRQDLSIRMITKDLFRDDPVVITPLTAGSRVGDPAGETV